MYLIKPKRGQVWLNIPLSNSVLDWEQLKNIDVCVMYFLALFLLHQVNISKHSREDLTFAKKGRGHLSVNISVF